MPKIFYVQLTVGNNEFFGEGKTRQAARHNAAMKALQALQNEPLPEKSSQVQSPAHLAAPVSHIPSQADEKTNKCIFKHKRKNHFIQERRREWPSPAIHFSDHLSTVLDACVPLG